MLIKLRASKQYFCNYNKLLRWTELKLIPNQSVNHYIYAHFGEHENYSEFVSARDVGDLSKSKSYIFY